MAIFILGLIVFFATHLWTGLARGPREALKAKLGDMGYRGLYSLVAATGFALIIIGWRSADATSLYTPPVWGRHVAYLLMFFALTALAAAYLPKGKIAAALKHPMLASIKIWAFAHLLANGEVRSLILFGTFLAYGVIDRIAAKRRGAAVPEAGPAVNDFIVVAVGAAAWAAIFFFAHGYITGIALI